MTQYEIPPSWLKVIGRIINQLLERLTGKDDLERVAYKEKPDLLNTYLQKRHIFVPQRPRRFLDASKFTREELLAQIKADAAQVSKESFEPWILEVDGKKRLPIFSCPKKACVFSAKVSQQLNQVFSLVCVQILLPDLMRKVRVDFVDLNPFNPKSWEIDIDRINPARP